MADDPTMARMRQVTIGAIERRPVVLAEPDPAWADQFDVERRLIAGALAETAVELHHVGSTSVAGLPAKPTLDLVLVVSDPVDEPAYVPALESIGYQLRIREPDWYQHRLLRRPPAEIHLHVFGPACAEVERMLRFRDHLRAHPDDRDEYADEKRRLGARDWPTVQHYADAKTEIITRILERAAAPEA
jgi:GrpB-like predicted nucleotidyltransferase (UPF0157 family)